MSKRTRRNRKLRKRGNQSRARHEDGKPRHGGNTLVWHYTTGQRFKDIVDDGFIRPAPARVAEDERPIVWFSSNQEWEPTSTKIYVAHDGETWRLSKEELRVRGNGLVRFGVTRRTARLDWTAMKRLSGMSRDTARDLKVIGRRLGSKPEWWYGSFDPVGRSEWVAIDVLDEGCECSGAANWWNVVLSARRPRWSAREPTRSVREKVGVTLSRGRPRDRPGSERGWPHGQRDVLLRQAVWTERGLNNG